MDEQPAHNHRTRDIKQDGSCPACAALLARQHGSLSAAEAERRDWLDQAAGPEHEAAPGDADLRDVDEG
jgi:hypothetical protein